jgi:hypothetical protein
MSSKKLYKITNTENKDTFVAARNITSAAKKYKHNDEDKNIKKISLISSRFFD